MKNIIYWIKRIFRRRPKFRIDGEIKGNGCSGYIETGWNPSEELYPGFSNYKNKLTETEKGE